MNERQEQAREEAIGWAMRVADPDFGDWTALTRWLEADPLHAAAFDEALAAGDAADAALKAAPPALPVVSRPARRRIAGGLLAAAIVGAIGWTAFEHRAAPYTVTTAPGETRTISLDGATIALNGSSRITLDRHDPRRATLENGEALFDVRHDADHPFRLTVGDAKLQDVGTRFDVTRDEGGLRVAVAEGAVLYNPDREAVRITAGAVLRERPGANQVTLGQIDPAGVGG
ncbi:MAG TPA: FecR domain-containing protein, partial [Sphingomonas sp.]|nr:FecR domain-containing protein [Sphingomonas sp.]